MRIVSDIVSGTGFCHKFFLKKREKRFGGKEKKRTFAIPKRKRGSTRAVKAGKCDK